MKQAWIAALALAAASTAAAQNAFEGNEYEGAHVLVVGNTSPVCPLTGTLRYRVQVRRDDMVVSVFRQGEAQPSVDTTPINQDGSFGRTRQFRDGTVSISYGWIEAQRIVWDIKVSYGRSGCVLRAELARVAGQTAK